MLLPAVAILAAATLDVPYVPQQKDTCGAASLAMVLRYWQDEVSHDEVAAALLLPELHGIAGSRLAEFARGRGMAGVAYRGDMADLRESVDKGRPLIVAWNMGHGRYHNVVVIGFDEGHHAVLVNDPARGPSRPVAEDSFEKRWARAGYWTLLVARDKAVARPSYEELVARGVSAGKAGRYDEAEQALQRAIGLQSDRPEARVELAGLRFMEKRYEDAVSGFTSALVYGPDPYARDMLAASLHLAGHTEDALKEWNRLGQPRVGAVTIKGLVHTREGLVRRELSVRPEDVLDLDEYRRSRLRLEELGVFSRIELRPLPKDAGRMDLEVDLAERHGFGSLLEVGVSNAIFALRRKVVLRYFNLAGEGGNLNVDYKWEKTQPHLVGGIDWPRPFGLPANLHIAGLGTRPTYDLGGTFTMRARGGDLGLRRVVGAGTVAEVGWRLRDRTFTVQRPDTPEGLLSGLKVGLEHRLVDRRRYRLDASLRGFYSAAALGADVSYPVGQIAFRYHAFISAPESAPIPATSVAAQLIVAGGGSRMPLDEMFAPGAASEMEYPLRGHRQKTHGVVGAVPMGRGLGLLNVELRQRLFQKKMATLGAVAFYDGARVSDTAQGGSRSTLHDVGLGLRLSVRGMLLRLDFGQSLTGDGKNAWTAGIGPVF